MSAVLSRKNKRNLTAKTKSKVLKSWSNEMAKMHTPKASVRFISADEVFSIALSNHDAEEVFCFLETHTSKCSDNVVIHASDCKIK